MLGQDTVREVDGLTIATRLHGYRGGGSVDIVAGRNPLEVWSSIQVASTISGATQLLGLIGQVVLPLIK